MAIADLTTDQLISQLRGSTSTSVDHDTRQKWVWAGHVEREEPGDGTAVCRELQTRGVLLADDPMDGFHVYEVASEWRDKIR